MSEEPTVDVIIERTGPYTVNRAWENWMSSSSGEIAALPRSTAPAPSQSRVLE